jgi:hypothetical protein
MYDYIVQNSFGAISEQQQTDVVDDAAQAMTPTSRCSARRKVQELELELMEIRTVFEEYITSSRELENGLDGGLGDWVS